MNLTKREKISYGVGAVGKDWVYGIVSGFLLIYFNTVLGVSGIFTGILFMCARVFDAVNDPMMGVIVEKTNSKMGKFRPWLLIGTISNAVILFAMFSVPESLSMTGVHIYISVAYLLWGITYTIMDIPYWSMIPAITSTGKERENISVIGRSCAGIGAALAAALTATLVRVFGGANERLGYQMYAGMVAVIFVITIAVTVVNVKEKNRVSKKNVSVKEMIQSLFQNDQAMVVVIAIIMFNASMYLTQSLATYFFKFDIGNYDLYGVFATVGGAAQIISMMLLPIFRKKMGCKKILIMAVSTALIGYFSLYGISCLSIRKDPVGLVCLCIAAVIIFFGFGLATVLTTIFLADTVDYGEWKNGQRNESVIFSLQTFVVKLASAISGLIGGISIDLIHLNKDLGTNQTAGTITGLHSIMCLVPMVGLLASIVFFTKKYKLDEAFLKEITEETEARKAE